MIWRSFAKRLPITSRRRGLATATLYGLSLAVRFTSAAGEQLEVPAQSVQRTNPAMSVMIGTGPRLPYEDLARAAQPIVFRSGWPLVSPGCRAGM